MAEDSDLLEDFEMFKEHFSQAILEENYEMQIIMTKKLGILAEHLGVKITRTELLPFIKENLDFHDEILYQLPEQLKQFIPLVGGYEHSKPVLDLLRKLCSTEETVVRDKAVQILRNIAEELSDELTEQLMVPLFENLSNVDWFSSKCSAVEIFTNIYPKVKEETKVALRHNFRLLSQDEYPLVRKAAAMCLIDLVPMLDKESLKNEFISVFDNISNDNLDSVQVNSVKIAIAICKRLTEPEIEQLIFPTLEKFSESKSWKMRQILALDISEIQDVIPFPKLRGKILAIFQNLIKDDEEKVRIIAVKNLVGYCRNLKNSYEKQAVENNFESVFLQSILPQIALLILDPSVDVKLTLARNILSLSTVISKEIFKKHLMSMIVDILEEDNSVPVKAAILETLNDLPANVDFVKSINSIKKIVRNLIVFSQSNWRTRKGLLLSFMHIARLTSKEYFTEHLQSSYASLLCDPVFAVRRTAPIILPLLAKQYGIKWIAEQIVPYLKLFTKDTRYLYRYIPLFGINELINPSIASENDVKYLNTLKESKYVDASKLLFKLKHLIRILTSKLEENNFKDILSLNKSIDDFKTDNIVLYAGEDTLDSLKDGYKNIFECNLENSDEWYLIGLITLIIKDFLDLILRLFDDKIVNVQIRSIFTLNNIKIFTNNVTKELEEHWVDDMIKLLSKEELDCIEKEIELELVVKSIGLDEEKIDTDLMENMFTNNEKTIYSTSIPDIKIEFAEDTNIEVAGNSNQTDNSNNVKDEQNTEKSQSSVNNDFDPNINKLKPELNKENTQDCDN